MNRTVAYIAGAGVAVIAYDAIKKGISASKAVPKFLTPRNFKRNKWTLTFDLPFSLLNVSGTSFTIEGLGGTIFYPNSTEDLEFASYFIEKPIEVLSNSNEVFIVKCTTYLPDVIGTIKAFYNKLERPIKFNTKGNVKFLGFTKSYDQDITISFVSDTIALIKTVFTIFK